jgi:hypothetical protein
MFQTRNKLVFVQKFAKGTKEWDSYVFLGQAWSQIFSKSPELKIRALCSCYPVLKPFNRRLRAIHRPSFGHFMSSPKCKSLPAQAAGRTFAAFQ